MNAEPCEKVVEVERKSESNGSRMGFEEELVEVTRGCRLPMGRSHCAKDLLNEIFKTMVTSFLLFQNVMDIFGRRIHDF